jgi:hypothetical protein
MDFDKFRNFADKIYPRGPDFPNDYPRSTNETFQAVGYLITEALYGRLDIENTDIKKLGERTLHYLKKLDNEIHFTKLDCDDQRRNAAHHKEISQDIAKKSINIIHVKFWSQPMEDWCSSSLSSKWECLRDNSEGYFIFENMESAALFKMFWAEHVYA